METVEIGGLLRAVTPIHHGGDEKTGNQAGLRRIKYIVDGDIVEVPFIDGNSIRGVLRRLVMSDMVKRLGYDDLNVKLYHTLFSGGMLESIGSSEQGQVNLELRKKIRENIIPVSILGCSIGNQILSGKLHVGKCLPACKELNTFIPPQEKNGLHHFLDWTFNTRKDDMHDSDESVQMKYEFEVFVPGTVFYHWFDLVDMTDLEKSCFKHMMVLWEKNPYVGGKIATGQGKIEMKYSFPKDIGPDKYVEFLKTNKDKIVGVLDEL